MMSQAPAQAERTFTGILAHAARLKAVYKKDLDPGDWVIVTTRNSTYSIHVLEDEVYLISGGWVDRHGLSPLRTTVTGCGWGGTVIKVDIVAACGLKLEFGRGVVTSTIQKIVVLQTVKPTRIQ
jgi:hypothetical protein